MKTENPQKKKKIDTSTKVNIYKHKYTVTKGCSEKIVVNKINVRF